MTTWGARSKVRLPPLTGKLDYDGRCLMMDLLATKDEEELSYMVAEREGQLLQALQRIDELEKAQAKKGRARSRA